MNQVYDNDVGANKIFNELIEDTKDENYYSNSHMKIGYTLILLAESNLQYINKFKKDTIKIIINNIHEGSYIDAVDKGIDVVIDNIRYVNFITKVRLGSIPTKISMKSDPLSSIISLSYIKDGIISPYFEKHARADSHHLALKVIELLGALSIKINYDQIVKLINLDISSIFLTDLSSCREIYKIVQKQSSKDNIESITRKAINLQVSNPQAAIWIKELFENFPKIKIIVSSVNFD